MGIRIHKDIGYYVPKQRLAKIFIKDYSEYLDDYEFPPNFLDNVQHKIEELESQFGIKDSLSLISLQGLKKQKTQLSSYDFIHTIFHGDSIKGIMLVPPDLSEYCRWDDLIDYLEHTINDSDPCRFKLQLLHAPVYPRTSYLCVKAPDIPEKVINKYIKVGSGLTLGQAVTARELRFIYSDEFDELIPQKQVLQNWVCLTNKREPFFRPFVDFIVYAMLLEIGLLQKNISYLEFIQLVEPAIVTYWC